MSGQPQQQQPAQPPVPGTPDYEAAMLAKFNSAGGTAVDTDAADEGDQQGQSKGDPTKAQDRPPGLPEKFKSVDDLIKAYTELERQYHASRKPADVGQPKPEAGKEGSQDQQQQAPKPVDLNALAQEIGQSGDLSKETREDLRKRGIPDELIDFHVDTIKARVEAQLAEINADMAKHLGGEDEYKRILEWGGQNLTEAEKTLLNAQMNAGPEGRQAAALAMRARYEAAVGKQPSLLGGKSGGASGYRSVEEMVADMKDPRYHKDPAFRAEVERRAANSAF